MIGMAQDGKTWVDINNNVAQKVAAYLKAAFASVRGMRFLHKDGVTVLAVLDDKRCTLNLDTLPGLYMGDPAINQKSAELVAAELVPDLLEKMKHEYRQRVMSIIQEIGADRIRSIRALSSNVASFELDGAYKTLALSNDWVEELMSMMIIESDPSLDGFVMA